MSNEVKQYFLGLDIGTNSVGWAVTDENYNVIRGKQFEVDSKGNVIKKNSVHLLGSRLFPEATTAQARRVNRNNRRRLIRRRWRIILLRELFENEMNKVDPTFFTRLDNSFFHKEDKQIDIQDMNLLFKGDKKESSYKTIYHLRKEMIKKANKKFDIREIYLVMSHMIKYRGNFLETGTYNFNSEKGISEILENDFKQLNDCLENLKSEELYEQKNIGTYDMNYFDAIYNLFKDTNGINNIKNSDGTKSFINDTKSLAYKLYLAIIGGTVKLKEIYEIIYGKDETDTYDEELLKLPLPYSSENFESDLEKLHLDEQIADLIIKGKETHDHRKLIYLLKGSASLSESMVKMYDNHHNQLQKLKAAIKKYKPELYKHFFSEFSQKDEDKTYADYIGSYYDKKDDKKPGKMIRGPHCKKEEFYKSVKTILGLDVKDKASLPDDLKKIAKYIEEDNFLLRQNSPDNGVIPYQLNEMELRQIIENQGQYYPFLKEKGKAYLNKEKEEYKLVSLLKFKIPYYVGPLSNKGLKDDKEKDKHNHWAQFKENQENIKIYPWNFEDVVDLDKSEEKFIERLTNKCSYILGENCLPKFSLYFQVYKILNALNNVTLNDKSLTFEEKKDIIEKLYLNKSKVSVNDYKKYFKEKYKDELGIDNFRTNNLKEFDKDNELIIHNLSSFVDFKDILGDDFYKDKHLFDKAEEIIILRTKIEDDERLEKHLKNVLPDLTDEQIKQICRLKYKGWSPLSKKLLVDLKSDFVDQYTGEVKSYNILQYLLYTNNNFMQLYEGKEVESKNTFKEQVEKYNSEIRDSNQINIDDLIDQTYVAPPMKRALHQTLNIIDELKKYLGHKTNNPEFKFDKIFVECTREKQESKKIDSRKKQIGDAYNEAKKQAKEMANEIDYLQQNELSKYSDDNLRGKKLFLYFMQLGRDVYSGEKIKLDELESKYDIDHIIPRAYGYKDDSFNNTVLVRKDLNNRKQDIYPIPSEILSEKGREWVKKLYSLKRKDKTSYFMPKEKMNKILSRVGLSDDQITGFVNRQLTMTNQAVKAVCDTLINIGYDKSKIIYSKASFVSDFRNYFNFIKIRDLNNYHHAHDAYLNIVVGNFYNKYFTNNFTKAKYIEFRNDRKTINTDSQHLFKCDRKLGTSNNYYWIAPKQVKILEKIKGEIQAAKDINWEDYLKLKENVNKDYKIEVVEYDGGTYDTIKKTLTKYHPLVTHMMYENKGAQGIFNKSSVSPAKECSSGLVLKLKTKENLDYPDRYNPEKYGNYTDLSTPYYMLVKYNYVKKGEQIFEYRILGIPQVFLMQYRNGTTIDEAKVKNYVIQLIKTDSKIELNDNDIEIVVNKILIKSCVELINRDDSHLTQALAVTGRSGKNLSYINTKELNIDSMYQRYLKKICKFLGTNLPSGKKVDLQQYEDLIKQEEGIVEFTKLTNISKNENLEFFEYLQSVVKKEYLDLISIFKKLVEFKPEQFNNEFDIITQVRIIYQIIQMLSCGKFAITFELIKGIKPNSKGTIVSSIFKSSIFLNDEEFRIINYSSTGLFKRILFSNIKD